MAVRASAIDEVGLLDDAYFMYCEEMDWCLRFARAGWRVFAVPSALVVHHGGQSTQQARWASFERLWLSRLRFFELHRDRYSSTHRAAIRFVVRTGIRIRAHQAFRRFAAGRLLGSELEEELRAYGTIDARCRDIGAG
jgi:GT2 family glycosyltransferase